MEDDPGWPWARRTPRGTPPGGLLGLRVIFSAFVTGVVLFGIVVMVIVAGSKTKPADHSLVFPLVVLGIAALLMLASRKVRPPLNSSTEETLSATFRGRCIVRSALAEGAALLGIVGFLACHQWWMVPVVVVIGVVGFAGAAPTARAVAGEHERLQAEGCPFSLIAVLNATPSTPRR